MSFYQPSASATTSAPPGPTTSSSGGGGGGGPTSSPLLFFVALGFGVVFTNLWIIVGVKYCFRYNQRNRALRNGEDPDPIDLGAIPRHRRRREKKLMTIDEMNEKFPLITYKEWKASRAAEGLPTEGGIAMDEVAKSRPASVRDADGAIETAGSARPSHEDESKTLAETSVQHKENSAPSVYVSPPSSPEPAEHSASAAATEFTPISPAKLSLSEERPVTSQSKAPTTTVSTENVDRVQTTDTDAADELEDEDKQIEDAAPVDQHDSGDVCSICLEVIEDQHQVRGLSCGHAFHADCVDPWFTVRRAMCPLCKHDYYVPKPRPEGEAAAEAERLARLRARPAPPQYAFMAGRGAVIRPFRPRLAAGRFMTIVYRDDDPRPGYNGPPPRAPGQEVPFDASNPDAQAAQQGSWWSRVSAFGSFRPTGPGAPSMPGRFRRGRNNDTTTATTGTEMGPAPAETTPAQLEAGRS